MIIKNQMKGVGGINMRQQALDNKTAWEHRAYEFWNSQASPAEKAAYIKQDPMARLRYHQAYFKDIIGKKIANPCGSNGRIAVPLALLGADVTVFDISKENKRYALELAKEAAVEINYIVNDFCETDTTEHGNKFDMVYSEGGILHYFSDINAFIKVIYEILKPKGILILSDFHPYRKINRTGSSMMSVEQTNGDYFETKLHNGNVAYHGFFPPDEQAEFPQCSLRFYTLMDIINTVLQAGFTLLEFLEHPSFEDRKLPGEFTVVARK